MSTLQADIEARLARVEPDVEVLLAEVVGGSRLRVYIDHPDGVTLGLCERVSLLLRDLREQYSLEVSSPGSERPLTKPAHYRRFVGRRARVRTRDPRAAECSPQRGGSAARRDFAARPLLSSTHSFRTGARVPVVAPKVGARPLFLRRGPNL